MVTGGVDGGDTIDTNRKTLCNIGGQNTIISGSVKALEEIEDPGVQGLRRGEGRQLLYSNVAVTLNDTVDQLLWGGIVGVGRVRERSGNQVADLEGDGEWGIGGDCVEVLGGIEFGGRLPIALDWFSKVQGKASPCYQRKEYHPWGLGYKNLF